MRRWKQFCSMLVKPGLSELRTLDNSLCSIIAVSEGLLTCSGNTMLVMQRFGIVRSGTEMKWEPTFPNPIQCANFNQRLLEQKVCLSQFYSQNLYSFNVQVKTVNDTQSNYSDITKEVKLRYTLDNWRTYTESPSLIRIDQSSHLVTNTNTYQWIETNESEIILSTIPLETKFYQLEFAVVYRGNNFEYWDNNNSQNYVCFSSSSYC
ncbi:unnamed protein product [Schistosoma curassoni]|uniref:CBM21 domain-containing protein n=1 Tax=Schistosoma curassoni TaxID=6186 RepID=A0A183KX87_9TREM|nr:unnamed protein product [Schistosoma curassoni]